MSADNLFLFAEKLNSLNYLVLFAFLQILLSMSATAIVSSIRLCTWRQDKDGPSKNAWSYFWVNFLDEESFKARNPKGLFFFFSIVDKNIIWVSLLGVEMAPCTKIYLNTIFSNHSYMQLRTVFTVQTWNCALTVGGFLGTPLPRCWLLNR